MIIDHGNWISYTPSTPKSVPGTLYHVQYARQDSPEAFDWYEYVASKRFGDTSVIMTVQHTDTGDVVQVATFDPTEIFPAPFQVIEETEYAGDDPMGDYHLHSYDAAARTIGGPHKYPEREPNVIEARILQALDMIVDRIEALEKR